MKRITTKEMRIGEMRAIPAPFPGQWPTRWDLKIENRLARKMVWEYEGKPNPVVWATFVKKVKALTQKQQAEYYVCAQEFDRQHIVARSYYAQIRNGGFYQSSHLLQAAYHFWDKSAEGFGWINTPHKVAVIATGKGQMRVYIPSKIDMYARKKYREVFGA